MPVYFIQSVYGGPIKIGYADEVLHRFKDIQTKSPLKLKILKITEGNRVLEKNLHKKFAHLITHGEWFEPVSELLTTIQELPELELDISPTLEECRFITTGRKKCRRYTQNGSKYCKVHQ